MHVAEITLEHTLIDAYHDTKEMEPGQNCSEDHGRCYSTTRVLSGGGQAKRLTMSGPHQTQNLPPTIQTLRDSEAAEDQEEQPLSCSKRFTTEPTRISVGKGDVTSPDGQDGDPEDHSSPAHFSPERKNQAISNPQQMSQNVLEERRSNVGQSKGRGYLPSQQEVPVVVEDGMRPQSQQIESAARGKNFTRFKIKNAFSVDTFLTLDGLVESRKRARTIAKSALLSCVVVDHQGTQQWFVGHMWKIGRHKLCKRHRRSIEGIRQRPG